MNNVFTPMSGRFEGAKITMGEDGVPRAKFRKTLIKKGQYVKDSENLEFTVSDGTLKHWATQFKRMTENGVRVPIPATHDGEGDPDKNRGYVVDMRVEGDELVGTCEMIGEDAITAAARSDVSISSPSTFVDGKGERYDRPIVHVAMVTDPVVPGLGEFVPIAASRRRVKTMDWTKIKEKMGIDVEITDANAEELILSHVDKVDKELKELKEQHEALTKKAEELKVELSKGSNGAVRKAVDPLLVKMTAENISNKFDGLVRAGHVTPAVKDKLTSIFVGEGEPTALEASMKSVEDPTKVIDQVVEALKSNDPVRLGELTGPQSDVDTVKLSRDKDNADVLLEDAKRRAEAAAKA